MMVYDSRDYYEHVCWIAAFRRIFRIKHIRFWQPIRWGGNGFIIHKHILYTSECVYTKGESVFSYSDRRVDNVKTHCSHPIVIQPQFYRTIKQKMFIQKKHENSAFIIVIFQYFFEYYFRSLKIPHFFQIWIVRSSSKIIMLALTFFDCNRRLARDTLWNWWFFLL